MNAISMIKHGSGSINAVKLLRLSRDWGSVHAKGNHGHLKMLISIGTKPAGLSYTARDEERFYRPAQYRSVAQAKIRRGLQK